MPSINEQLEELRQEFRNGVPGRIQELVDLAGQAELGDHGALRQLQLRAHTMVGSAGVYGFHDLSKKAKELELFVNVILDDVVTEDASPPEYMWRYIGQFLSDLQQIGRNLSAELDVPAPTADFFQAIDLGQQLILYVTDDELGGRGISAMLMDCGHLVELSSPADVDYKIEALKPDFVFLSLTTSRIDGRELARKIRSKSAERYLPMFFLTSRHDVETFVSCIAAGADDVVHKPFDTRMLLSKMFAVQRLLSR